MLVQRRITWGAGLNADAPAFELEDGFFSSGQNVRVRHGVAERIMGTTGTYLTFSHTPFWLGALRHTTPAQGFWLLAAGSAKVYASNFSTSSEITRYTEGKTILSMTAAGTTVTVTTSALHQRTTGDAISIWGCTPSTYNTDSATITVTSPTTFTYTVPSAPATSPATVVGLYSYNGATSDFSAIAGVWTGSEMGGVYFLNCNSGLYYWAGSTSIRLRKVRGSYVAQVSRGFKNYIVQLAPTMSGTKYPYRILWSTSTEPGAVPTSFDSTSTNDAGYVDRTEGGACVDCLPLGDVNIVYKQQGRFAMELIPGSNEIFRFTQLPGTEGLLGANCVVDTPVGHVFLSSNYQVLLHTGGACTNLSDGRVNSLIRKTSSATYFVAKNSQQNEVWIFIVTIGGSSFPDRALVWNWKTDTWGVREYGSQRVPFAVETFWSADKREYVAAVNSSGALVLEDQSGTTLFGDSFDTEIERTGLDMGDPQRTKNLQRSRWNFTMAGGSTATIEHGSAKTANATPTYTAGATPYTVGTTDQVCARATGGKYLAVKATWTAEGGVRSSDLEFALAGLR